jgi:hypothetical protein
LHLCLGGESHRDDGFGLRLTRVASFEFFGLRDVEHGGDPAAVTRGLFDLPGNRVHDRVQNQESQRNYPAIFEGFKAKGIPADQIQPHVNVLTFKAWRALGRVVKMGEHGVKIATLIPVTDKTDSKASVASGSGTATAAAVSMRRWSGWYRVGFVLRVTCCV